LSEHAPIPGPPSRDLSIPDPKARNLRPPIGLLISIGEPKPNDKQPGRQIEYFRFKAGDLEQYEKHAARAREVYGEQPAELSDLFFLAATPPEVLDVRLRCWSKAGLRGFGATNYAAIPDPQVFLDRAWAFDDDFTFRPRKLSEVRQDLRASWQGEPVTGQLQGPDDPRLGKLGISLECTLAVCLPEVMGVGLVALISTKSRRSITNLYGAVWDHYRAFGTLLGYPFRLTNRKRKTERFDSEKREYAVAHVQELVLDTPFTFADVLDAIRERRDAIGVPERLMLEAQSRVAGQALALPLPEEDVRTRDEPGLVERPSDAQLNRIALLESEYAGDLTALLKGAYDVDSAEELSPEQAAVYEDTLTRLVEEKAEPVAPEEAEVIEEEKGEFSFEQLVPDKVKKAE